MNEPERHENESRYQTLDNKISFWRRDPDRWTQWPCDTCSGSEAQRCGRCGQGSGRHPHGHAATPFGYLSEEQNIQHFAVRLKFWTSRLQLSTYQQQKRGRGPSGSLPVGGVAAAVCVAFKPSFIYVAPLGGSVDLTRGGFFHTLHGGLARTVRTCVVSDEPTVETIVHLAGLNRSLFSSPCIAGFL